MNITFCGGANEVGASCILLKVGNKNILIDCGMRMSGDPIPNFDSIRNSGGIDLIIISHAHMDHIGTLPIVSNEYPNAPIIMTHMTKDLLRVLLYDSLKIMDLRESEIPIFSEVHVKNMMDRIICFSPEFEISPFDDDVKITMYSAGHIPGAVFIYIVSNDGSLFYSGDFSITPQLAVGGGSIPKLRPDVGIFESTYGNRLHSNREIELNLLLNKIVEVVSSGNKILIPAFALGRAQEIILFLINSMNKGKCPEFKIYVDGMVNDICRVFKNNPNYLRERYAKKIYKGMDIFYNDYVIPVKKSEASRKELLSKDEGLCIISSSGMLSGGPSSFYAKYLASNENNFIALTGYQDEESPGAKLLELANSPSDSEKQLKLGEEVVNLKCGIGMFGLSAHADKSQILALIHSLSPKETFFVHGSEESVNEISSTFQKEHFGKTYIPQNGEQFSFDFSKNKRKQIKKETLKTLNKYYESLKDVTEDDMYEFWKFLNSNYPNTKGFTLEDLSYVLTGFIPKEGLMEFNKKLYECKYFEIETKRPHIFHYVNPEDIKSDDIFMEVNEALALAEETFTPFGLYKKGARFEEKIILLSFDFPITASLNVKDKIEEFVNKTKWKVEINSECSKEACEILIESLLPNGINCIKIPSYYRLDNCFRVTLNKLDFDYKNVENEFFEKTGINLYLSEYSEKPKVINTVINKVPGQVEQNVAFKAIDEAFLNCDDKIYKKSLKVNNGGSYIELSFISPQIGQKYQDIIDKLEIDLRWHIEISQSVNQSEVFKIARDILKRNECSVKKLSYMPEKESVKVSTLQVISEDIKNSIKNEFQKFTGLLLEF